MTISIEKTKEAIRQAEFPYKSISFGHVVTYGNVMELPYMVTDTDNNRHTDSLEVIL